MAVPRGAAVVALLLWICLGQIQAQSSLRGEVQDETGQALQGATISLKGQYQLYDISDSLGRFALSFPEPIAPGDTLVISYIGYQTHYQACASSDSQFTVRLQKQDRYLEEVMIYFKPALSKVFSTKVLEQLEVYIDPNSQADPFKAVNSLPVSTTTDESATINLRGSSAERTRVYVNDVPLYNPTIVNQLNNIGNFSVFNNSILDELEVYGSNPPLFLGNASGGAINIRTKDKASRLRNLIISLANVGVFLSLPTASDKQFHQVFANYSFDDALRYTNDGGLAEVNDFTYADLGYNFHARLGEKTRINFLTHFLSDRGSFPINLFAYEGDYGTDSKRNYTITNLVRYFKNGKLSWDNGFSFARNQATFGNLDLRTREGNLYSGLNYKFFFSDQLTAHVGIAFEYQHFGYEGRQPLYYYAYQPEAPTFDSTQQVRLLNLDAFAFLKWQPWERWYLSVGLRKNLPLQSVADYFTYQANLRWNADEHQSFILAYGRYHNYSLPRYYDPRFTALFSKQIALDYTLEFRRTQVGLGAFMKWEDERPVWDLRAGAPLVEQQLWGLELSLNQAIGQSLQFQISNTFLDARTLGTDGQFYKSANALDYFIKSRLEYSDPRLFTLSLAYMGRSGTWYTPVMGGRFNPAIGRYEPIYSGALNSARYGSYHILNANLSRQFRWRKKLNITAFMGLNNALNQQNERGVIYSSDYQERDFTYFSTRTLYVGAIVFF